MNYKARFIDGMTLEQINTELKEMFERQYRYGCSIDRPYMWDLEYTRRCLKGQKGAR